MYISHVKLKLSYEYYCLPPFFLSIWTDWTNEPFTHLFCLPFYEKEENPRMLGCQKPLQRYGHLTKYFSRRCDAQVEIQQLHKNNNEYIYKYSHND